MKTPDTNFKKYWLKESYKINWLKKPKNTIDLIGSNVKWYKDGLVNAFYSCIESKISAHDNKICINYYDKNNNLYKYTLKEMSDYVKKFSYEINSRSKKKIKNIIIYGSASIETAIAMFACSQLGIHFSVIFQDLSFDAVILRAKLLQADFIISRCTDKKFYSEILKSKMFRRKNIIFFHKDERLDISKIYKLDLNYLKNSKNKINLVKKLRPNSDFFSLFTSGSTGQPKGITHSLGNYLVYANHTCRNKFGMKKNSIILTASDAGWINGHTYALFGPLSIGSSTVILERPAMLLDEDFLNKVISECKISILYLPVTLIRMMRSVFTKKPKKKYIKTIITSS